jgi:N-acetylmuramoyl-L-alanine amidase
VNSPRVVRLDNARWHGGERGTAPAIILWHSTRSHGSALDAISYLNSTTEKKASYGYVIDRDGTIYRMLNAEQVAWHAGDSDWPNPKVGDGTEDCRPNGGKSLNAVSLGICWANAPGEKLTPEQTTSGLWLAKVYIARYDIPVPLNLGHLEVSPGRKVDPDSLGFSMDEWRPFAP